MRATPYARRAAGLLTLALAAGYAAGCNEAPRHGPESAAAGTSAAGAPARGACRVPAGGLRLTADTVAGLPTDETIEALRRRCPRARLDSVGMGGFSAAALRFDFPGATVWAIQDDYEDTLRPAKPASVWAAEGDSLRFASGALVPRSVGALRQMDSVGAVILDTGDDTEGSYAVLCREPDVQIIFGTALEVGAKSVLTRLSRTEALTPLWGVAPGDTLAYWRVDVGRSDYDADVRRFCARVAAPGTRH